MMREPKIKRWRARRRTGLIKQIYRGTNTIPDAARKHDVNQTEADIFVFRINIKAKQPHHPKLQFRHKSLT